MLHVVLFVFYDKQTKRVLSEHRPPDHPLFPNRKTFPTGKVKEDEHDNIEKALFRELKEEFGITPIHYIPLNTLEGEKNVLLHPFIIEQWHGAIPSVILDKGNALLWETFEEAASSQIKTRKKIIEMLEDYIKNS